MIPMRQPVAFDDISVGGLLHELADQSKIGYFSHDATSHAPESSQPHSAGISDCCPMEPTVPGALFTAQQGLLGHTLQIKMTMKMPALSWHTVDRWRTLNAQTIADHGSEEGKDHPAVDPIFVTQWQHRQTLTQQGNITLSTVLLLETLEMAAASYGGGAVQQSRAVVWVRQGRDLMSQGSEQAAGAATIGLVMDNI